MSVEMKLGRWKTRGGGCVDIVRSASNMWRSDSGSLWYENGQWERDKDGHRLDLVEYIGPVDAPKFDPKSLKPGDYCVCLVAGMSVKRLVAGWLSNGKIVLEAGGDAITADESSTHWPRGPWQPKAPPEHVTAHDARRVANSVIDAMPEVAKITELVLGKIRDAYSNGQTEMRITEPACNKGRILQRVREHLEERGFEVHSLSSRNDPGPNDWIIRW
jgi:hypothetical protein